MDAIDNWKTCETKHYVFHFIPDSFAHHNLKSIVDLQEFCYSDIIRQLRVRKFPFPIRYFLYETAKDLAGNCKINPNDDITGLARYPDQVHAVYSPEMKCVGYHEDVHIIATQLMGDNPKLFFREGLAMFFDEVWWGLPNKLWTQIFLKEQIYPGISALMNNEQFSRFSSAITYPVCGAFTYFLVRSYGMTCYKKLYKRLAKTDPAKSFNKILRNDLKTVEQLFIQYVLHSRYSQELHALVSSYLPEIFDSFPSDIVKRSFKKRNLLEQA
jgi:hypothetical protein